MRYTAIVVLLAMWLTFAVTNASPLPAKTDSGTGKFDIQKLIEGATKELSHPDEAKAQDCEWYDWISCGGVVAACVGSCYTLNAPACVTCLGSLYDQCVGCVSDYFTYKMEKIQKQGKIMQSQNPRLHHVPDDNFLKGTMKQSQNALISSHNEEKIKSQNTLISPHNAATAQICDDSTTYYCVSLLFDCVNSYSCSDDFEESSCVTCFGDLYYTCLYCFTDLSLEDKKNQEEKMKSQNALISPHNVANAQSCGWFEWAECGGIVAQCATSCFNLQASSCISCVGDSYNTCIGCFSRLQKEKARLMMN